MKLKTRQNLAAFAICLAASAPAGAQYPVKTIRLIVPVGAGAGTDIVARFIAPPLATALGRQIVIDNRPGVGGNIGAEVAANSPPDGYTLMMGYVSQAINMTLYAKPGYDLVKDFAPIAHVVTGPFLVAVHPTVPVKSVKELIALAKARPGQVNVGLAGSGLILAAHLFYNMAGVKMTDVLYRSTPQSLTALLSGEVSVGFLPVSSALPQVKSGKLRALAVTKSQRIAVAPELPTVAEAGLPGYEATSWYGLMAPAKTPGEIVARLNAETNKALQLPEVRAQYASVDFEPGGGTVEQFGALVRADVEKWGKLVRAAGLKPD
jgi:tripartite-type tricarboxylate transporter receptor subunit TctC